MTEMTEHTEQQTPPPKSESRKLSDEAIGIILLFAAIPLIAYIKWNFDDNVTLGAVASIILGASAIVLRKKFGSD